MRLAGIGLCAAAMIAASTAMAQAAGDPARGKIVFKQCSACHTAIPNVRDSMGPGLFGVVGRKAGTKPGYTYSDAMKKSGIVWSEASLKTFVMKPMETVPGSNMFFNGIGNSAQADDLVAYLASLK
jgi:cytochrome c